MPDRLSSPRAARPRPGGVSRLALLALALLAFGCGDAGSPTSPDLQPDAGGNVPRLALGAPESSTDLDWYPVAKKTVRFGQVARVSGSRYSLLFAPGSVIGAPIDVTIHEHDPDVVDVQFGPHGAKFGVPVTVTIQYEGTALDPAHPDYVPGLLRFYWQDTVLGLWVPMPGLDNPLTKTYTVTLTHFSRYTLSRTGPSGTADW
jgi:hypothetical protein